MPRIRITFLSTLLVLPLAACSSNSDSDKPEQPKRAEASRGDAGSPVRCDTASSSTPCSDDPDPCGLHSGYEGDQYCVLPPPPGKGIQIHFGPKSYTDPAEIAKYVLNPGEEFNAYGIAHVPMLEDHYYNYVQIRMRPGSHHLINTIVQGTDLPEGFTAAGSGCGGTTIGGFAGSQNLVRDMPPGGVQAPENVGIGSSLPGNSSICLNHHAYNFTENVRIREVWMNVWFVDESQVTQKTSSVIVAAGPWTPIPAHTEQVLTTTTTINGTGRIINMFGHRHSHTERFDVFQNDVLVYDSWHWEESTVFDYDSITTNPAPNPDGKTDGATTGILNVVPGDKIKVECHVNNDSDAALPFRNELNTGEMCILFGSAVGVTIGGLPTGVTPPS